MSVKCFDLNYEPSWRSRCKKRSQWGIDDILEWRRLFQNLCCTITFPLSPSLTHLLANVLHYEGGGRRTWDLKWWGWYGACICISLEDFLLLVLLTAHCSHNAMEHGSTSSSPPDLQTSTGRPETKARFGHSSFSSCDWLIDSPLKANLTALPIHNMMVPSLVSPSVGHKVERWIRRKTLRMRGCESSPNEHSSISNRHQSV